MGVSLKERGGICLGIRTSVVEGTPEVTRANESTLEAAPICKQCISSRIPHHMTTFSKLLLVHERCRRSVTNEPSKIVSFENRTSS